MKKTAEEILKENTKRTLNIVEDSPLHVAVIKAMEEYRSQSELPSDEECNEIAFRKLLLTGRTESEEIQDRKLIIEGLTIMRSIASPILASHDARILELEEDLYRINLLNKQYSNFRNEVLEIPDELIKQIDNKHFPF